MLTRRFWSNCSTLAAYETRIFTQFIAALLFVYLSHCRKLPFIAIVQLTAAGALNERPPE